MAGNYANNALAAKVRAMFGKRLTPQNYRELLRKQTVNEVAAYLKQQTNYGGVLSDVNENLIHRGQLETILHRQMFDEYQKMFHFVNQADSGFFSFITARMEIEEILKCIRLLNSGHQGEYIYTLPSFLSKHTSFDLYALAKARSLTDLLDILKNTAYAEIIEKYVSSEKNEPDTVKMEIELKMYYYKRMLKFIETEYSGTTRENVRKSVGMEIDLENLTIVLRLKKYFNAAPDYIRSLLLPIYSKVSADEMNRIIFEPDTNAAWKSILGTYYGVYFKKYSFDFIEKYSRQIKYSFSKSLLMFSNAAPDVIMSYTELKSTELDNIINIIEGIRYSLPPSEISKLLIGSEE